MDIDEIKRLLMQAKEDGLTGETTRIMREATATRAGQKAIERQAFQDELKHQSITGLEPALGPAGALLPGMGTVLPAAQAGLGIGTGIGHAIQDGYLSNGGFDEIAMAGMGMLGGLPLIGRKGQGKLYSRAQHAAIEEGLDLATLNETVLGKFFKRHDIKPEEQKLIQQFRVSENDRGPLSPSSYLDYLQHQLVEPLGPEAAGNSHAFKDFHRYANFSGNTFPEVAKDLGVPKDNLLIRNALMDIKNKYPGTMTHWKGADGPVGDIHARIGVDPNKNLGILAEVQSDLQKQLNNQQVKAEPFINNYESIGARKGLLDLVNEFNRTIPGQDATVVVPTGGFHQQIKDSTATAFKDIYDKKVPRALEEVTGQKFTTPEKLERPYTPIEITNDAEAQHRLWSGKLVKHMKDKFGYDIIHNNQGDFPDNYTHPKHKEELDIVNKIYLDKLIEQKKLVDKAVATYKANIPADIQDVLIKADNAKWWARNDLENLQHKHRNIMQEHLAEAKAAHPMGEVTSRVTPVGPNFTPEVHAGIAVTDLYKEAAAKFFQANTPETSIQSKLEFDQVYNKLLKEFFSTLPTPEPKLTPGNLHHLNLPAETIKRLSTEGIPLWMLPIGAGLGMAGASNYNSQKEPQPQ